MKIYISEGKGEENELEMYVRELENVNDTLADENEALRKELEEAASMKADDAIAELKRDVIKELEDCPAEKIKESVVRIVSMLLTGGW